MSAQPPTPPPTTTGREALLHFKAMYLKAVHAYHGERALCAFEGCETEPCPSLRALLAAPSGATGARRAPTCDVCGRLGPRCCSRIDGLEQRVDSLSADTGEPCDACRAAGFRECHGPHALTPPAARPEGDEWGRAISQAAEVVRRAELRARTVSPSAVRLLSETVEIITSLQRPEREARS